MGVRTDVAPPVFVLRNRQKGERAKLACQSCRRDNKKVRGLFSLVVYGSLEVVFFPHCSVMISDPVRGVFNGTKSAFMLAGDRSLSSFDVKDAGRRIANVKTLGPASSASNKGGSA